MKRKTARSYGNPLNPAAIAVIVRRPSFGDVPDPTRRRAIPTARAATEDKNCTFRPLVDDRVANPRAEKLGIFFGDNLKRKKPQNPTKIPLTRRPQSPLLRDDRRPKTGFRENGVEQCFARRGRARYAVNCRIISVGHTTDNGRRPWKIRFLCRRRTSRKQRWTVTGGVRDSVSGNGFFVQAERFASQSTDLVSLSLTLSVFFFYRFSIPPVRCVRARHTCMLDAFYSVNNRPIRTIAA